jgi:hypothetical protein
VGWLAYSGANKRGHWVAARSGSVHDTPLLSGSLLFDVSCCRSNVDK